MSAPTTKVFGRGLTRMMQVLFAVQVVTQAGVLVSEVAAGEGWDWWSGSRLVLVVLSLVGILFAETSIVRVGGDRIRWWTWRGHRIDLAVEEVADVRRHPSRKNRVQLVTTDGQVLRLPVQPDDGPAVWWHLFGDRSAAASPDRG